MWLVRNTAAGAPPQTEVGLFDVSSLTNTFFDSTPGGNALVYKEFNSAWRRGLSTSLCVTHATLSPFNSTNFAMNGCGVAIDFSNKLFWFFQPHAAGGGGLSPWMGKHSISSYVSCPSPYSLGAMASVKGIPISLTAATSMLRIGINARIETTGYTSQFYINGGQLPFSFHPLLPGVRSMNGGRSVAPGQGDSWDVVNNPISLTYGAAGVSCFLNNAPGIVGAQCAQAKSTGKKYFELHLEGDYTVAGWYLGLRREAATTMTAGVSVALLIDKALMVQPNNNGGARWRYGVNIGSWTATASYSTGSINSMAPWMGVAVDFDAGRMWVGQWNYNERAMRWGAASDPAAGTNPHITFTVNESLRIFVCNGGVTLRRVNLIQDDNNVVGLPAGFETWGGTAPASVTDTPSASPSAAIAASARNIWPTGVIT